MSDDMHEAAKAAPDIPYRHLFAGLYHPNLAEFGQQVASKLNDIARLGGTVVHISTSTLQGKDGIVHVGHVIFTLGVDQRRAVADVLADELDC